MVHSLAWAIGSFGIDGRGFFEFSVVGWIGRGRRSGRARARSPNGLVGSEPSSTATEQDRPRRFDSGRSMPLRRPCDVG